MAEKPRAIENRVERRYVMPNKIKKHNSGNRWRVRFCILVMMLWVYYSAAILLLGATFTFTRADIKNGTDTINE